MKHYVPLVAMQCLNIICFQNYPRMRNARCKSSKLTSWVVWTPGFIAPNCRSPFHDIAISSIPYCEMLDCKIAARTVLGSRSSWWAARYHGAGSRMILDTGKQIEMDNDGGFGRVQWKSCPQNLEGIKPRHSSEAQTFRSNSVVVPSRWSTSMYLAYIRTPIDYLRRREGGIYPINKPWSTNLAEHENKDHERNITINS